MREREREREHKVSLLHDHEEFPTLELLQEC